MSFDAGVLGPMLGAFAPKRRKMSERRSVSRSATESLNRLAARAREAWRLGSLWRADWRAQARRIGWLR